jgi:hypothetical protein
MSLLNLSLLEFLAVFLPVSATVVALYLYDRVHRRQIVSTLRFFERVTQSPVFTRRKKIQQPWSLILQLVSLALLLLAIAELQFGRRAEPARDHVLILETSAWMNATMPGAGNSRPNRSGGAGDGRISLMDVARRRALEYLRAVPSSDRVMLVRADQLATPVTPFTKNRSQLEQAIRTSHPGSTALNLPAALDLARSSQRLAARRPGEIAVIGSGRVMRRDLERAAGETPNLRAILLGGEPHNCGIRKLSARRLPGDPLTWEIDVGAYNYGATEQRTSLTLAFAGSRIGSGALALAPHSAAEARFRLRSAQGGTLSAVLDSKDEYRADNKAEIELPRLSPLKIQVFTNKPSLWRPLLTASPFLDPEFHTPGEYSPGGPPRRLVIIDGFRPAAPPRADALWIPPAAAQGTEKVVVRHWNPAHPISSGLHNKDIRVSRATILDARGPEFVIAESDDRPVLVASAGEFKKVVFGFHPLEEGTDNHVAVPLLFANLVRWVSPDLFRSSEISAGPPGLIEMQVPAGTRREQVQITSAQLRVLPFTLVGDRLRFFAGQAGTVHVTTPEREWVYALNLPEVGETRWMPPPGARRGVPPPAAAAPLNRDLWPWLALAGAIGLLIEWILYGRQPVAAPAASSRAVRAVQPGVETAAHAEPEHEEVHS